MIISMTVRELIDKDLWEMVCHIKGINLYAVNEGVMRSDERIAFSTEEAKRLGIIPRNMS